MKLVCFLSHIWATCAAVSLTVKLPSALDLISDPCAAFRLPPKSVNGTFLEQSGVERLWIEPPTNFGYGKWALAWTSISQYWNWSNIQNEWFPLQSSYDTEHISGIQATAIADINSFQVGDNDTIITTPGLDRLLSGEVFAWNYTIPADIMSETDNTAWVGWGYDLHEQGAPYFVSYDASTTGVINVSYGISIYSQRERGPSDRTVAEIFECYEALGSTDFTALAQSMRRTPTDGRRSESLSWRAPRWRPADCVQEESDHVEARLG